MKRILTLILAVALIFTLSVPAMAVRVGVESLTASGTASSVTVSGTTGAGVLAVMVEILDSDSSSVAMQSFAVSDGSFSGDITGLSLTPGAVYGVRAANYAGGLWTSASFAVPLPPAPSVSVRTLTFETNGGDGMNALSLKKGSVVELAQYVPTRAGYEFSAWYSDEALTNAVTDVTLTENLTVYAGWSWRNPFVDVQESDFFYDAVRWAMEGKITDGTSHTTFSPNVRCTRAQMAAFLWRAAGSPEPASALKPFSDVSAEDYYYKAVLWAAEKGITLGTNDDRSTFSPNDTCTRGQTVTFLYRYAGSPTMTGSNPFTDVATSDYYCNAVIWAAVEGVTEGTSTTTFSPKDGCTRGQIVEFLYRYFAE